MGKLYLILIAIMVFITISLAGLFAPEFPVGSPETTEFEGYECCNTGSKENCRVADDAPTIGYDNQQYRLLKSNVFMDNKDTFHLNAAPNNVRRNGERVFINPSETRNTPRPPGCPTAEDGTNDRLYGRPVPGYTYGCYRIPNDILIYLCRADNGPGMCEGRVSPAKARFDVYIRTSKGEPIPEVVKDCYKPPLDPATEKKIVFRLSPEGQPNLQLRTFAFILGPTKATWLSPFCKPAIYLYPERKTEINVSVFPQGEMLLTIPPYPKTGWDVIAEPNGIIYHKNDRFDYLYYEASLPDQLITKPKEGYVIDYDKRALFLTELVTKLGLNEKETKQFVDYWVPILPKSPYYFIGIIPDTKLNELSPVLITPKPKNLIRVTLYFQALDEKISVTPPLILPVDRSGFTAVEWGGIFKQDKNHPFSCFM